MRSAAPTPQPFISDEELFAKYGKFCGYMAWQFVKRGGSFAEDPQGTRLDTEDAEDLASVAVYYLLRIKQQFRDQPPYIKRVIVSKIITAWHKRLKHAGKEFQAPEIAESERPNSTDYFDTLPGRDGPAESTQYSFDSHKIISLLPKLTHAERIVVELHFGLNGAKPCGTQRIATKLARTRWWVDARLNSALNELRRHSGITAKPSLQPVL